jgi:hypothetical protein
MTKSQVRAQVDTVLAETQLPRNIPSTPLPLHPPSHLPTARPSMSRILGIAPKWPCPYNIMAGSALAVSALCSDSTGPRRDSHRQASSLLGCG